MFDFLRWSALFCGFRSEKLDSYLHGIRRQFKASPPILSDELRSLLILSGPSYQWYLLNKKERAVDRISYTWPCLGQSQLRTTVKFLNLVKNARHEGCLVHGHIYPIKRVAAERRVWSPKLNCFFCFRALLIKDFDEMNFIFFIISDFICIHLSDGLKRESQSRIFQGK